MDLVVLVFCHITVVVFISIIMLVALYFCFGIFFFFQAEDGIRDLVRSRGLGDVYKRQSLAVENIADFVAAYIIGNLLQMAFRFWAFRRFVSVSYTHLTLPTSDLV